MDIFGVEALTLNTTEHYENQAREANKQENWDQIWVKEGLESWRGQVLGTVYERIASLIPKGSRVIDLGGGVGIFAQKLRDDRGCTVTIYDISPAALEIARQHDFSTRVVDVEDTLTPFAFEDCDVVVSTECLEHLSKTARTRVLEAASKVGKAFITVPNDRLGPEIEPQHTIQFTAMSLKHEVKEHFKDVRIECVGPCEKPFVPAFLLAVLGFPKGNHPGTNRPFTMSFTMPVRNEEKDIERTLASFRAVADEIVIGVDYRSDDNTREIAKKYADVVFEIDDPTGPPEDLAPKVHFGHIRSRCMDMCTSDWIFMSEGHESLKKGVDTLLHLDTLMPKGVKVGYVLRTGQRQKWGFPWVTSGHDSRIRYRRQTHNDLIIPDDVLKVKMPQVETWHFRDHGNAEERKAQRKIQNRITLTSDWLKNGSQHSLWHLASEWREFDREKAIELYQEFLRSDSKIGDAKYQARLILAKEFCTLAEELRAANNEDGWTKKLEEAKEILIPATGDNWWRTEHWIRLGDIAAEQDRWDEALQFYKYATSQVNNPPFVLWWFDVENYTYLPAQKMASAYAALGYYAEALVWAEQAVTLMEENREDLTPEEIEEAKSNVVLIQKAITQGMEI